MIRPFCQAVKLINCNGMRTIRYPASDKLHIEAGESIRSYRIFNAQGTLIESADNGAREFEINVSHWSQGYYTLELQGAFRSIYRPIIITY